MVVAAADSRVATVRRCVNAAFDWGITMTPKECAERLRRGSNNITQHRAAEHLDAYAALLAGVDAGDEELARRLDTLAMLRAQDDAEARELAEGQAAVRLRALSVRVGTLFEAIKHGDDEHMRWLRKAIEDHFAGRTVERVAGSGSAEKIAALSARVAELKGALDEYMIQHGDGCGCNGCRMARAALSPPAKEDGDG
jgi:hypothetical protein